MRPFTQFLRLRRLLGYGLGVVLSLLSLGWRAEAATAHPESWRLALMDSKYSYACVFWIDQGKPNQFGRMTGRKKNVFSAYSSREIKTKSRTIRDRKQRARFIGSHQRCQILSLTDPALTPPNPPDSPPAPPPPPPPDPGPEACTRETPCAPTQLQFVYPPASVHMAGSVLFAELSLLTANGEVAVWDDLTAIRFSVLSAQQETIATELRTAIAGIVTTSGLQLTQAGTFRLIAEAASLPTLSSSQFTVNAGPLSRIEWLASPPDRIISGTTSAPIVVIAKDQFGNLSTTEDSALTLQIVGGNNHVNMETSTHFANGWAAFPGVNLTDLGRYIAQIRSPHVSSSTHSIDVSCGAPASLSLRISLPPVVNIHQVIAPSPSLEVRNAVGALCTDNSTLRLIASDLNDGSGLSGTNELQITNGIATFDSLRFTVGGSRQIRFSDESGELSTLSAPIEVRTRSTYALSWDARGTEGLEHLAPWYMVRYADILTRGLNNIVAQAKAATDRMPEGHRTLMLFHDMSPDVQEPEDLVRDAAGNIQGYQDPVRGFQPYQSVWWDSASQRSRNKVAGFINAYANAGGRLDYVVMDTETWHSNWYMDVIAARDYGADRENNAPDAAEANRIAYYQAMSSDPRLNRPDLEQFGFLDLRPLSTQLTRGTLVPHVSNWFDYNSPLNAHFNAHLEWNAIGQERSAIYKNYACFEPIRRRYPNVRMSDYGYSFNSPRYEVPDGNGNRTYQFGDRIRTIVGNAQSIPLYGNIKHNLILRRSERSPITLEGTPYNAALFELNSMRAARLSKPDVPFQPWIAFKSFGNQPSHKCSNCYLSNSDYYQELLYHVALSVDGVFLFWNPALGTSVPGLANSSDNELVDRVLAEYDRMADHSINRQTLFNDIIDWESSYILTSQRGDHGTLSRFTPRLSPGQTRESVLVSEFPAEFNVNGQILTIPNGRVIADSLSTVGYWIFIPPS